MCVCVCVCVRRAARATVLVLLRKPGLLRQEKCAAPAPPISTSRRNLDDRSRFEIRDFMTNRQYLSSDKVIYPIFFLAPHGRRGQVTSKVGILRLNQGGKPSYMVMNTYMYYRYIYP